VNESTRSTGGVGRRLVVILPCVGAILVLAAAMLPGGQNIGAGVRTWLSIVSGPLACWIEISMRYTPKEKMYYALLAIALVLGMLSHSLWPRTLTVAITVIASCLWLFFGFALTYMGWGQHHMSGISSTTAGSPAAGRSTTLKFLQKKGLQGFWGAYILWRLVPAGVAQG
jgi:hypothetical protein